MPVDLREAGKTDLPEIVDILADGLAEDPMFRWMFGPGDFDPMLRGWLELVTELALAKGPAHITAGGDAAAVWTALGVPLAGPDDFERAGVFLAGGVGEHAESVLAGLGAAGGHKPESPPSVQLAYVAARRDRQGRGLGAEVLAPVLAECDSEGHHAYLHSTNPRNIPFYERLGFERIAEVPMPGGDAVITPMWREPR